jgi:tetratricopeptide (TPR) repeat protein
MLGNLMLAQDDFTHAISLNAEPTPWAQHNLDNLNDQLDTLNAAPEAAVILPVETVASSNINSLLMEAAAARYSNDWEQTIERATAVIDATTENANAYIYRADGYYVLDRFEEALTDFNRAIELDPDNAYALDGRAYTKAYLGDFEGARADYERARAIQNIFVNDHLTLGTIESVAGNAEVAGVEFLAAMEMLEIERIEHEAVQIGDEVTVEMAEGRVVSVPFAGEAGQVVSFDAQSDEADALLVLLDPDGQPIAGDDDSATRLNAILPVVELPSDGTYTLLIGHAGGGSYGAITVAMTVQ